MKKSTELRKQRDALFVRIKELRDQIAADGHEETAEERHNWDSLNKDYDAVTERIAREERFEALESDRDQPTDPGIPDDARPQDRRDRTTTRTATTEQRALAFQGWARNVTGTGGGATKQQVEAANQIGFNINTRELGIPLFNGCEGTGEWPAFREAFMHEKRGSEPWKASATQNWQRRDQSTVIDTAGGYLVPEGFVNNLERALLQFGGMRQVASVIRTASGNDLPWPTTDDTSNTGEQVGENASATEQDVTFGATVFQAYKFSSKVVPVSRELLNDSAFDFAAVLGSLLGERIGRIENTRYTTGTGAATPRGITIASTAGKTTASATAITADEILDLIDSVDPAYRALPGTGFMMHDSIRTYVRKLKDGGGRYLFHPDGNQADASEPMRIFGYPVTINQDMASTVATTNITMEFGHLPHYYIRDVQEVRFMSSEHRYFEQDQVAFVAFHRTDGDILDAGTNPIKHMVQA